MFAMVWASISCPSVPEMELMVQSNGPSTLRILAGFGLVTIYIEDSNLDPPKAEKHLLSIIAVDSYFKPYAEGTLALVYEKMREIREETHLDVKLGKMLPPFETIVQEGGETLLHVVYVDFLAQVSRGRLQPDDDIAEAEWWSHNDILTRWQELHHDTQRLLTLAGLVGGPRGTEPFCDL